MIGPDRQSGFNDLCESATNRRHPQPPRRPVRTRETPRDRPKAPRKSTATLCGIVRYKPTATRRRRSARTRTPRHRRDRASPRSPSKTRASSAASSTPPMRVPRRENRRGVRCERPPQVTALSATVRRSRGGPIPRRSVRRTRNALYDRVGRDRVGRDRAIDATSRRRLRRSAARVDDHWNPACRPPPGLPTTRLSTPRGAQPPASVSAPSIASTASGSSKTSLGSSWLCFTLLIFSSIVCIPPPITCWTANGYLRPSISW